MTISDFLEQVKVICDLNPVYSLGHSGADGKCDCIGLIIGAVERNGKRWEGIHGSNWWARNYTKNLEFIHGAASLQAGDLVYKAHALGDTGYALPARYAGHSDLNDYYHVGVVTAVEPLQITHCTSGGGVNGITRDTKAGEWKFHGSLTLITNSDSTEKNVENEAVVKSPNGKPVNLRRTASTSGHLVDRIPVGAKGLVLEKGTEWSKVSFGDRTGYMMNMFLDLPELGSALEQRVSELTRTVAELVERVNAHERRISELEGNG